MSEVRITSHLDEGAWRLFAEAQSGANIFHAPEMYRVFERARHHRPTLLAATDGSGSPLALLLPVEVTLVEGPFRSWTSRAVAYGGLLCADDPAGRRAVQPLLAAYRRATRRRQLFTELRHLGDASRIEGALRSEGFVHEEHLNYLIDLDRSEEVLWEAFAKTAQQRIRSGQKKGVVVEEISDVPGSDETYQMLANAYRRVGIPLADPSLFRAALSSLHPAGMFRIFAARLGERIIGTRYVLAYKDRILDWYAGADRAFASYSPNEVLVWHTLRWGQAHGYRIFDFGGAGRPDEPYGPREFKAKFGGELVNFGRDTLVHAPSRLKLSQAGYALARRFLWGRAPERRGSESTEAHRSPGSANAHTDNRLAKRGTE